MFTLRRAADWFGIHREGAFLFAGGLVVVVLGTWLLARGRHSDGFGDNVLINGATAAIELGVVVALVNPIVAYLNRHGSRWRRRLNYPMVIDKITDAESRVDIWKYWTSLLDDTYRSRFLDALTDAANRDVEIRIVIVDPTCPDAKRRSDQVNLKPRSAIDLMRGNIEHLDGFLRSARLTEQGRSRVKVKVMRRGPAYAIYAVDDWLSCGLFRGQKISEGEQRQMRVDGDVGRILLDPLDRIWNDDADGMTIDAFLRLAVTVHDGPAMRLRYVEVEGELFVSLSPAEFGAIGGHAVVLAGPQGIRTYTVEFGPAWVGPEAVQAVTQKYGGLTRKTHLGRLVAADQQRLGAPRQRQQ